MFHQTFKGLRQRAGNYECQLITHPVKKIRKSKRQVDAEHGVIWHSMWDNFELTSTKPHYKPRRHRIKNRQVNVDQPRRAMLFDRKID
jgi:hypothetical protein